MSNDINACLSACINKILDMRDARGNVSEHDLRALCTLAIAGLSYTEDQSSLYLFSDYLAAMRKFVDAE